MLQPTITSATNTGGKQKQTRHFNSQEMNTRLEKTSAFLRNQEEMLRNAKQFLEKHTRESTERYHRTKANLDYCHHLLTEQEYYTDGKPKTMVLIGKINGEDRHVPINALRIPPASRPNDILYLEALLQMKDITAFDFSHYPKIATHAGEPVWMPTTANECVDLLERFAGKDSEAPHENYRKLVKHFLECEGGKGGKCGLKFKNQDLSF